MLADDRLLKELGQVVMMVVREVIRGKLETLPAGYRA